MSYKIGYIQEISDELSTGGSSSDWGVYIDPKIPVDPGGITADPVAVEAPVPALPPAVIETLPVTTETLTSMESFGNVTAGGAPVIASMKWFNVRTGEVYATMQSDHFHVWADTDIPNVRLSIAAPGYQSVTLKAAEMQVQNDVTLRKPISSAVLLAALLAFIAFAKKRKKEVGKVTTADVFPFMLIGGGVLAFVLIKEILEKLGIWKSKDEKELDNTTTDPNSWWSPNFWRSKPAGVSWSYVIDTATAIEWSKQIYDAFGAFNDCEECAIAVFKRCRTKANASFLSDIFSQRYGEDLLTFLRGGWWPQDRLSDEDVNVINNYVNQLPNY
jgi:hypothetical protein